MHSKRKTVSIFLRYVHVTELLSQMPTEEQLEREIRSVMFTAFGCSMTLPRLHRSLQPRSRLRVVTERSLKGFLLDHVDAFSVDDGNVIKLLGSPDDMSTAAARAESVDGASQTDSASVAEDDGDSLDSDMHPSVSRVFNEEGKLVTLASLRRACY